MPSLKGQPSIGIGCPSGPEMDFGPDGEFTPWVIEPDGLGNVIASLVVLVWGRCSLCRVRWNLMHPAFSRVAEGQAAPMPREFSGGGR